MEVSDNDEHLYRSSVIVTGSHYSTTTVIGMLLSSAPDFNMVHEPLNAEPTLSYDSVKPGRWYKYYDQAHYPELKRELKRFMFAEGLPVELLKRFGAARSLRDLGRIGRYAQRKTPMLLNHRRAIFKDPFMLFSSHTAQQVDGMNVVLTLRHPCAFLESYRRRRDKRFEFVDLQQPALLAMVPELADELDGFCRHEQSEAVEAAFIWRFVYTFADRWLMPDPRTIAVKQEDLVSDPLPTARALFDFVGAQYGPWVEDFVSRNLEAEHVDFAKAGAYHVRDAQATLNKWRERIPAEDQLIMRRELGEIAHRMGYDDSNW